MPTLYLRDKMGLRIFSHHVESERSVRAVIFMGKKRTIPMSGESIGVYRAYPEILLVRVGFIYRE